MSKEEIKTLIQNAFAHRVAVRVYNEQEISHSDMEFILDSAWLSPSSIGLEGWRFVVLNRKQIAKLRDALKAVAWGAQSQLETASHFVFLLAEKNARFDSEIVKNSLIRRGINDESAIDNRLAFYESFQKHDMQIADNPRLLFEWTAKQTYIALGNMLTTASMLGIDSCPIEGFDYDSVNRILANAGLIDSDKEGIASMASFGYRLQNPKHPHSRKPREEVISWVD